MNKFEIIRYYSLESIFTKFFIFLRIASCPFSELISYIPKTGVLLDIGCGYGLLSIQLAIRNQKQRITGIDPDVKRINIAKKASDKFQNLEFISSTASKMGGQKRYEIVTITDVMYLLPYSAKVETVKKVYSLLKKKGMLFIKINDKSCTINFFLTWLQEIMTVFLLEKTKTKYSTLHFENAQEIEKILRDNHFEVQKIVKLSTPFPFFHPHWLIVAVK